MVEMFNKYAPNAKVLFHCCGSVYDIIPDFIEIGIDILNPVQPVAKKKDTSALKQELGNEICFQGGIDLQRALIGDLDDVKTEVKERIRTLAPGGGFVLATANNIGYDVPVENAIQLYKLAKEYGTYPISID
jgi:uroporphyrinogen decarboxylase